MFCVKCKFNGFDHLSKCPKCGFNWKEAREALQLSWLQSNGYDWFRHHSPQTAPDAKEALSADASPDLIFAPKASPVLDLDIPDTSPEGLRHGPLLIEKGTFVGPADEKSTKNAYGESDGFSPQLLSPREASHEPSQGPPRLAPDIHAETPDFPGNEDTIRPLLEAFPEEPLSAGSKTASAPKEQASPALNEPSVLEEILLEDDVSTEGVLATWEIPDELIPKETDESAPSREQPDSESPTKQEAAVLVEEIVYDFSAFEAKTGQPSDADSSKPTEPGNPSGSNKDERS